MTIKFRELITHAGTLIIAGKDAKSNEALVNGAGENEEILHTVAAGSPFVNIGGKMKMGDIKTAAIFCARYSRDWKKNKGDVIVHRFKKADVYKTKLMKTGTFGIKKFRTIKVKKEWIKNWQE